MKKRKRAKKPITIPTWPIVEKEIPFIIQAILQSAITNIPDIYAILFPTDSEIDEDQIDDMISFFLARIPIFFMAMPKLDCNSLSTIFDFIFFLFSTTSPSIVTEIAKQLSKTLKSPEFHSEDFLRTLQNERLQIIEICSSLISKDINTLPLAQYDTEWQLNKNNSAIFQLISTIAEVFDGTLLVEQISQLILQNDQINHPLYGLIRMMNAVIPGQPTEEFVISVKESLRNVFNFLISHIQTMNQATQEFTCKLLTKIMHYIDFDQESSTVLFNHLLQILPQINQKNSEPFSVFFLEFSDAFINLIQFPIEIIQSFDINFPCFWITRIILAKLSILTQTDLLGSTLQLAIEALSSVNKTGQEGILQINTILGRVLEFLSLIPNECFDISLGPQICEILVNLLNIVINESDEASTRQQEQTEINSTNEFTYISRAFYNVIRAILHINEISFEFAPDILENLTPPSLINHITLAWCKEAIEPLISSFKDCDEASCASYTEQLISHFLTIITEQELPTKDLITKMYQYFCSISVYLTDESACEILNICIEQEDANIFVSLTNAISSRNFAFLSYFWPKLFIRKDPKCVDAVCSMLLTFIEKGDFPLDQIEKLPGVKQEELATLSLRLQAAKTAKTKKRHIKSFVNTI